MSRNRNSLLMSVAVAALLTAAPAFAGPALPTGGNVTSGQASIATGGNNVTVNQTSRTAIINWNSFSVGNGASAQFNNGNGATLNRVTGNLGSQIDGTLSATGSLYLVNPAGVIVGPTGRVSTGGSFVASTHDVSDSDFNGTGDKTFKGDSTAAVINYGHIGSLGGDVTLIARQVQNNGTIKAPKGTVGLAAGTQVLLSDSTVTGGRISVQASGAGDTVTAGGAIKAADVELKTNNGNIYALAGNTAGIIKATGIKAGDGHIYFDAGSAGSVTVGGTVSAKNADGTGGTITATGGNVTLASTAALDASGTTGGTILIGGDRHGGSDPSLKFVAQPIGTAQNTTVAAGATIKADGTKGAGGNVVVWSDQHTNFGGAISATGNGGNGGFAEVSSRNLLGFHGTVDLLSTGGTVGNLLLDPADITISTAADTDAGSPAPTGATSNLNNATLDGLLEGASVTVTTSSGSGGTGNITVSAPITWDTASVLTLHADNDIAINADITATVGGLTLSAKSAGDVLPTLANATVTDSGAINVGSFILTQGNWVQNSATLPTFTAANFEVLGVSPTVTASFLRVLGGTGTTASPFQITDVYGLQGMAGGVNETTVNSLTGKATAVGYTNLLTASWVLANDIDASVTATWNQDGSGTFEGFRPIASANKSERITTLLSTDTVSPAFQGVFDGQSHVITGLVIDLPSTTTDPQNYSAGLFGVVGIRNSGGGGGGPTIKNVGLVAASVTQGNSGGGTSAAGALIGWAGLGTYINLFSDGGTVSNASGDVAGGLIGRLIGGQTATTLSNSWSTGTVTGDLDAGGLVGGNGLNNGSVGFTINNSWADATVTAVQVAGGLIGNTGNVILNNTYALGSVTGVFAGGLVGDAGSGGSGVTINNSFASNTVATSNSTNGLTGGLVGENVGVFNNAYWNTTTGPANGTNSIDVAGSAAGPETTSGSVGLSDEQMHDQSNFAGFDFTNTWAAPANGTGTDTAGDTGLSWMPLLIGVSHAMVVSPDAATVTYTGAAPTLTATVLGLQEGDTSTAAVVGNNAGPDFNVGGYTTSVTADPTVNYLSQNHQPVYLIVNRTGTLTINPAPVTTTITYTIDNATSTYGTLAVLGTVTLNGVLGADVGNVAGTAGVRDGSGNPLTLTALTNAGTYAEYVAGLTGSAASNYVIDGSEVSNGTLTINAAVLTIATAGTINATKVYDGGTGVTVLTDGTTAGSTFGTDAPTPVLTASYGDKNVGTGKNVTGAYTLTGAGASNYTIDPSTNSFTATADITPAQLTIASQGTVADKVYNGGLSGAAASNGTLSGVVSGDNVTLSLGGLNFATKDVGTAIGVTGTYALGGADDGNYQLTSSTAFSGSGNITPATLTIGTAGTVNGRVYDGLTDATVATNGALGGTVFGSDAVTLSLGSVAFTDKNAGPAKAVAGTYTLGGADAGDYQLASTAFNGTAAITPVTLTINNEGTVANKVYDGTTNALLSGSTFAGEIGGDDVTLAVVGGFANKNVGNDKAVNGSFSLGGADAGNYTLGTGGTFSGTADITPATLTIATAGTIANKVYNGNATANAATNGTLGGVISGDTVTLALGNTTFANKNAGVGKAVTGAYVVGGTDAGNYVLASTAFSGIATITPATLTIATPGTVNGKAYDGTTAATVASSGGLGGVVSGDAVTLTLGGVAFGDKNAGPAKPVTGTYTVGGADAGNYTLASTAFSGTAAITPATLTVASAATIATKAYDGTTTATADSNGSLGGTIIGSDVVTLALGSASFADKNAGVGKTVTGTYTLGGADAGNYQLVSTAFSGTGVITPAVLTIATSGSVANKVYDGTTTATITGDGTLAGVIGTEDVSLTLTAAAFADKNVGQGKTVNGTYVLGGADDGNYQLASTAFQGSANITPATLAYVADPASRLVGDPNPAFTGSVSGFVAGETLGTATTGTAAFTSTADATSPSGHYAIDGAGLTADNGNYVFVQAPANTSALTVTQAGPPPAVTDAIQSTPNFVEATPQLGTSTNGSFYPGSNPAGANPETGNGTPNAPSGNTPNSIYPGNTNLGPWLTFASNGN